MHHRLNEAIEKFENFLCMLRLQHQNKKGIDYDTFYEYRTLTKRVEAGMLAEHYRHENGEYPK